MAIGADRGELDRLFDGFSIPAPARPLLQGGLANFTPRSDAAREIRTERGPLRMIAAGPDSA
ncbi:hypothetical protein [Nocardia sp. NPDC050793]|uniref:hypothetical protein n=1 Tax=Nocardia sp. NPDC050793 TaxID=3155159 RepID=UPI0033D5481C